METELIKNALAIVGVTQMLKSFIPIKKGWIWTIITTLVGVVICLIPSQCLTPIITISGATIFYDTIFQAFEKVFKRNGEEK